MERTSRLRRYIRKDYSQTVAFPVEIVGRDGHVRRYRFDESVELYHRRLRTAPMRYGDSALIDAEMRHCRQRIAQLRRSYLEQHGWEGLRGAPPFLGEYAADVAGFLRRAFGDAADNLSVRPIDHAGGALAWVGEAATGRAWLLHGHVLGDPAAVARWRAARAVLAAAPVGVDVERLHVAWEGPDVAMALTGTGAWDGPVLESSSDEGDSREDAWQEGLRIWFDGQPEAALRVLEAGLDRQPQRVALSRGAAVVALVLGEHERAAFSARFGRLEHPRDGMLAGLDMLVSARLGQLTRAREASAVAAGASDAWARLAVAAFAIAEGRFDDARRAVAACRPEAGSYVDRLRRRAVRAVAARGAVLCGVVAAALAGGALAPDLLAPAAAAAVVAAPIVAVLELRAAAWRAVRGDARTLGLLSAEMLPREAAPSAN